MIPLRKRVITLAAFYCWSTFGLICAQVSTPQAGSPDRPAAVVFDGETLFTIPTRVGAFSPQDRANATAQRIGSLVRSRQASALTVSNTEAASDIAAGDEIIATVTDDDAKALGRSRQELAAEYSRKIQAAVERFQRHYGIKSILVGTLLALLVTAILIGILFLFGKVFPRIYRKLDSWRGVHIRPLRIQNLELMSADRIAGFLAGTVGLLRLVATLVLFYVYISIVFSFFYQTRGYAAVLLGYVRSAFGTVFQAIAAATPDFLLMVVIAAIARFLIKLAHFFFRGLEHGTITIQGFYQEWAQPTYKIVRFLILALALMMAFPYIPGSNSAAFKGVSIFLGILFSLGSTGAVSNMIAGIVLTYTRAFAIGDRVKIGETMGDVVEKTLLATRIRTIKNEDITIPNGIVLASHIVNYNAAVKLPGLILHTAVTIGYDAPWRTVHELLIAAAQATGRVLRDPAPFVLQTALNDFYVTYQINAYTAEPSEMMGIYSELHQNIQDRFNEAGVEICSPHFSALRDANPIAIPRAYVPKDYTPPAFRVFSAGDGR